MPLSISYLPRSCVMSLVPTLCVGTSASTLCVVPSSRRPSDAERRATMFPRGAWEQGTDRPTEMLNSAAPQPTPLSILLPGGPSEPTCRSRLRPAIRIGGQSSLLQKTGCFRRQSRLLRRPECSTAFPLTRPSGTLSPGGRGRQGLGARSASHTGCVKAPLRAMSQASRRSHLRPVTSSLWLSDCLLNARVSDRSIRSR
jgi:hypothetical protein